MNKWLRKMLIGLCCLCMGTAVGLTAACTDDEESSATSETESSTSVESGENDLGSSEGESVSEEEEPCEHVWDNGEIVAKGTPDEIFGEHENPRLREFLRKVL